MAKITLATLTSAFASITNLNANFTAIATAFENTLSRDGTSPNTMGATLDMNSNQITNLPQATTATEPVRFGDISTEIQNAGVQSQGAWATSTAYTTNNLVTNNGSSYIATSDHTSAAATEPGVGASWMTVWVLAASAGATGATGAAGADGNDGVFDGTEATVTAASGDKVALLDVSDSENPKYALASDFLGGGGGGSVGESTLVYISSNDTGNGSGTTTVSWDAEERDDLGLWTSGTNFVVPVALNGAVLQFSAAVRTSSLGTGNRLRVNFTITGSPQGNGVYEGDGGASNGGCSIISGPITVSTGDTIALQVNSDDTNWDILANQQTWMAAVRLA